MSGCGRPASTAVVPSGAGVWRVGWWRWGFVGTLLGPEGAGPGAPPAGGVAGGFFEAGPFRVSDRRPPVGVFGSGGAGRGGGCLLVENCTVDASIFTGTVCLSGRGVSGFCRVVCVCWLSC